jgi:hypothetical protein
VAQYAFQCAGGRYIERVTDSMIHSSFWQDVGSQTLGGIIAALIVLPIAYIAVDHRLHLKDALARRTEREQDRNERRERVLKVLHEELESDAGALQLASEVLAKGQVSIPLFDTTTVSVAFQSGLFESLPPEMASALLHVRNRMLTANELHAMVFDFDQGQTAVLAALAAGSMTDPGIAKNYERFEQHRKDVKARLLDRIQNLGPHLYHAIDLIEDELGIEDPVPAAKRKYERDEIRR